MNTTQERQQAVRDEARKELLTGFAPIEQDETIYCILRSRSRSGMSRKVDFLHFSNNAGEVPQPVWLTYWIHALIHGEHPTRQQADNGEGMTIRGCGLDVGEHTIQRVSFYLFGERGKLRARWL